jgi:hypothetical protein
MNLKRLLLVVMVPMLGTASYAADEPKPASLTPDEIAEGWIMLFDGESVFGWNQAGEGKWNVVEGMLAPEKDNKCSLVTATGFFDYKLEVQYRLSKEGKPEIVLGCGKNGEDVEGTKHEKLPGEASNDWIKLQLKVSNRVLSSFSSSQGSTATKRDLRKAPPPFTSGHIAIVGDGVVIRQIRLQPINAKPIFNGKDLTDWKEIPGKKSKCSVNKDGLLEIKDGPGDLQTEGQWSDFVLQLDCRCNGDNNNSGVFLRALPGQFWQGYESQIYNRNDEAKPQEYTLQDFDPATHELKGTRKVKYAAQDYGTGGIYNRQPARKQAATDHEWFVMTVVAQGRHIGVWVNGYMVTDWTDNRPIKESARDGCRLEKGCISLQGHDPTTDLNFRNIRISELPPVTDK